MPRPTKFRRVEFFPEDTYFIPWGKQKCEIKEIVLKVEELEAMSRTSTVVLFVVQIELFAVKK